MKQFLSLLLSSCIFSCFCIPTAEAVIVFSNEYTIENTGSAWVIDAQNSTGGAANIVLQFGTSLAKTLSYDVTNSRFLFDDHVNFSKKQLQDFAIDNKAVAPLAPALGQEYFNTTDNKPYVWNGTAWIDLTAIGNGSSKVITVGTSQDYPTLSAAASYLNPLGGGIIILTPEVHVVSTSINLNNISILGRDPANTTIQLSGSGLITTGSSRFSYLSITALAGTTATRVLDLLTGASQVRFEDVKVTINDASDSLIASSALPAPAASITFVQSEQVGANGFIVPAIASSGLNVATKITIAGTSSNNMLRMNDWPVTIRDTGNVLTSGILTPIPVNEIKLIPGMNIQGAINSLPSGGSISLLAGTYNITAPLQLSNGNLTVSGSGDGTIISQSGFAGITQDTAVIQVGSVNGSAPISNITLKDFKIAVNDNVHGIKVTGGDDNQIQNISIQKVAGTPGSGTSARIGILVTDSSAAITSRPVVKNTRITGNGGSISFTDGIHISGDTASPGTWGFNQGIVNALVEGNNVDYVRETGFLVGNARGSSLFNNRVRRTGVGGATNSLGIYITRATDFSMVANQFTGTLDITAQAICIDCFDAGGARATTDSVFTDNLIDGNADSGSGFSAGIAIGAATNTTVHRNIIQSNSILGSATGTTNAILVTNDADSNLFADNTISGGTNAWTNGINILNSTADKNILQGNRFTNTTNLILNVGTSTQFAGYIVRNTTAPTVTDDSSKGYDTGLIWINSTTNTAYILVNNAIGAAIWTTLGGGGSSLNLSSALEIFEDWISNTAVGNIGWTTTNGGTAAASTIAAAISDVNHPGVLQMSTGTTTTGNTRNFLGTTNLLAGGGAMSFESLVQVPTLSTAGNEFALRVGLGDGTTGDFTDGVYFEYNRPTSVNWIMKTASNATRTTTPTSSVVTAGAWVKLRAEVNTGGTLVTYFINGTQVGTINTNIPTGAGRQVAPLLQMVKSTGTTAILSYVDYYILHKDFSTAR